MVRQVGVVPATHIHLSPMVDFTSIKSEYPLMEVVSRYVEVSIRGSEYIGLCPFHDDHKPSFSVYTADDGFHKFRCFACGIGGDVLDFVQEIEHCDVKTAVRKLSGGELPAIGTFSPPAPQKSQSPLWEPIVPVPDDAPEWNPKQTYNPKSGKTWQMKPVRKDEYLNADGQLMFYVARIEWDDGAKMTPMITWCKGPEGRRAWCSKAVNAPYPLQGLDQLAKRPKDMVVVVSGEKCFQTACEELPAYVVVSWPGGDKRIESVDVSPLLGKWIIAWPDADPPGNAAMLALHNRLKRLEQGAAV